TIQAIIDGVTSIEGKGIGGQKTTFYKESEIKERLKDFLSLPEADSETGEIIHNGGIFTPINRLVKKLGISDKTIQDVIAGVTFFEGRSANGRATTFYKESEIREKLEKSGYFIRKNIISEKQQAEEQEQKLKENYDNFVNEVVEGQTLEAQEFWKILSVFGSSKAIDILYKYRSEFTGIPMEYIKSSLAKHLGDFLIIRNNFHIEDINIAIPYLSDKNLQDALFEVIKENCLSYYHERKLKNKSADDKEIITKYIESIKSKTLNFNNQEIIKIIDQVEIYYLSILNDFEKPRHIVDAIKEDRPFPDINQILNIKEIAEKKKMLIGDEMGMGKSASAVLSKEYLGAKLALVVVPSNVESVWQKYLSDKISEEGEQIGYFKEGAAPRVLIVEDIKSLEGANPDSFDYILISQEKMNEQYLEELRKLDYDMLIIDEIHKLKNIEEGKRAQHILDLAGDMEGENKYLVLLSGTPVPNKIKDVAITLKLFYPEKFKSINNKDFTESIIRGELIDLRNLLVPRMQMKALRESVNMPELKEETAMVKLSPAEEEIYRVLLEDDELTADQKIMAFRMFTMNPSSLEITPDVEGSKVNVVKEHLNNVFQTKNKIVMFVNSYVNGIIRGENNIVEKFDLSPDIIIRIIDGSATKGESGEREKIEKELKETTKKILLVVSGQTADVGVDFSAAEEVLIYNEPWTEYDKKQQIARVYRPGLKHDLTVTTFITEGTIEEGIREHIKLKYNAVQKLLKGVPITDIEKDILRKSEKQETPDIEGDIEIAKEWLSSPQNQLHRFFRRTKEIGEENFHKFLLEHGDEYAECYFDVMGRGFQANTGRVVGSIFERFSKENERKSSNIKILDIASGPEMLKKHTSDKLSDKIISIDANKYHFLNKDDKALNTSSKGKIVVGGFTKLPFKKGTFEYANLSLALHYSRFIPSRGEYERLAVLSEMNRVMKKGGRAVINLIYSLQLKDQEKFKAIAGKVGFSVIDNYTGEISSGFNYKSHCIVLEKVDNIDNNPTNLVEQIGKENLDGLKLQWSGISSLKNSKHIINEFVMNNQKIPITFNKEDQKIFDEEKSIIKEGEKLIEEYGSIKAIPKNKIIGGFLKIFYGGRYRLLKKSEIIDDFVNIR
ncbi:MAG: SNF2-related protein, partial [Patescibacteria group bacterium]